MIRDSDAVYVHFNVCQGKYVTTPEIFDRRNYVLPSLSHKLSCAI